MLLTRGRCVGTLSLGGGWPTLAKQSCSHRGASHAHVCEALARLFVAREGKRVERAEMGAVHGTAVGAASEIVDSKSASGRFAPDEVAMLQKAFKTYGSGSSIDKLTFIRNTLSMIPEPVQTVSCLVLLLPFAYSLIIHAPTTKECRVVFSFNSFAWM